jgi:subtilisin family serine protease
VEVRNAGRAELQLKSIGALTGTKAGNVWTVHIPPARVKEVTTFTSLSYIELDQPAFPELNVARSTTRVDSVHRGINLPAIYNGQDVIVGIIDFGFDYNHPAFFDTLYQQYRISRVWELNGVGSPPPGFTYGNELTDSVSIKIQGTDDPLQMHGTSVAGIAAGSGYGSAGNNRFRGVAYKSEMVLVGVRRDTIAAQWQQGTFTDFIDGVNYIFNYAASVGKPCVINISWGSQSGPHDGTTLLNHAFNSMTGPGRIIVMSAGNEGTEKIHLSKSFTATDTTLSTFLKFSSNVINYKRTWVDVWSDSLKTFCANVTLYASNVTGATTPKVCLDNNVHDFILINSNGVDTCFVQFINSTAEFNGRPRMIIDIYNKGYDSIAVNFTAQNQDMDMWNEYYYYGYKYGYQCSFDSLAQSWARSGNSISTVSDMGNRRNDYI